MTTPRWSEAADGFPYRLFSFHASAAGVPTHAPVTDVQPIDPGYHLEAGGVLDLIIAGASVAMLVRSRCGRIARQPVARDYPTVR